MREAGVCGAEERRMLWVIIGKGEADCALMIGIFVDLTGDGQLDPAQISESALLTQGGSEVAELIPGGKISSSSSQNISCNLFLMPNKDEQLRNVRTMQERRSR